MVLARAVWEVRAVMARTESPAARFFTFQTRAMAFCLPSDIEKSHFPAAPLQSRYDAWLRVVCVGRNSKMRQNYNSVVNSSDGRIVKAEVKKMFLSIAVS